MNGQYKLRYDFFENYFMREIWKIFSLKSTMHIQKYKTFTICNCFLAFLKKLSILDFRHLNWIQKHVIYLHFQVPGGDFSIYFNII